MTLTFRFNDLNGNAKSVEEINKLEPETNVIESLCDVKVKGEEAKCTWPIKVTCNFTYFTDFTYFKYFPYYSHFSYFSYFSYFS